MDSNVTTIFLSMALTIAFTQLVKLQSPGWEIWVIFFYFAFRKISYYVADVRFNELSLKIFRQETVTERMFNLFFGVSTLFLFIVSGYFVSSPVKFYFWSAFTLLINIAWIILLLVLIDPEKDKNHKLSIRAMFKNFIFINIAEIVIFTISALWLNGQWATKGLTFEEIKPWIFGISLGGLGFIMLIDFLLHKYFLFDPNYSVEES